MSYIDLHTHTTASDGTDTPSKLVLNAVDKKLSAIAITDHDTVSGISEALEASRELPIEVISGIELSCLYNDKDLHMLGYFVDYTNQTFLDKLEELKKKREFRNEQMRQKLEEHGIVLTMEQIQGQAKQSVITRAHFAKAMEEAGYIKSKEEAFLKYIGDGCPCFVQKLRFTPQEAIDLIHSAGGVAVLAHPLIYKMSYDEIDLLLKYLKECGLTGVEVYHSSHNISNSGKLREMIRPYHLLPTGGSDYHGSNKQNVQLGCGYGGMAISHSLLDDLKQAHSRLRNFS